MRLFRVFGPFAYDTIGVFVNIAESKEKIALVGAHEVVVKPLCISSQCQPTVFILKFDVPCDIRSRECKYNPGNQQGYNYKEPHHRNQVVLMHAPAK
jgi:hypothetical protein